MCINKQGANTTKKELITSNIFDLKEEDIKTEKVCLIVEKTTAKTGNKSVERTAGVQYLSESSANTDKSRSSFSSCLGG